MSVFTLKSSHPKEIKCCGEGFSLSCAKKIKITATEDACLSLIAERFPSVPVETVPGCGKFTLAVCGDGSELAIPSAPDKPDAYAVTVSKDGIAACANTEAGLFYAVETIVNLPEYAEGEEIVDYASIPLRMLHWDLKGYLPKFEVLCEEMRLIARYKANAILLELEDKYDYNCVKGFAVEGAYSYDQMREFSRLCASLHIRIVPKLQSIAHVDYILKHREFANLRENGHVFQYCAVNPGVKELWNSMAAELMDVFREHAEGGYFHIGADEPGNLGECPKCHKLGAAGAYRYRIASSVEFVKSHGWKPVMWDDIVRNGMEDDKGPLRADFGRDAVMMYWSYGYGGVNNTFPCLEGYLSEGLTVFGASGYAGCDNWAGSVPPMEYRALNIDAWTKAAVEHGLNSVCATGWTRIGSADCPADAVESSWFTIIYAALSMWTGEAFDYKEFIKEMFSDFYSAEVDEALAATAFSISKHPYTFANALSSLVDGERDRLAFLKVAAAAESMGGTRDRLLNYFQYYDGKLGNKMEDYRLGFVRGNTERIIRDLETWKKKAEELYSEYYMPVTVEEIIRTRFGYLEKAAGLMNELLAKTDTM